MSKMILIEEATVKLALENICAAKLCEFNSMSSRHEMLRLMDAAITAIKEAMAEQPKQQEDPCPGCRKGGVCRTPKCGRLKLPADHPYRTEQPAQQEPTVAAAWQQGYDQGVADERTSEANIGIAGFDAKVNPARNNPYSAKQPAQDQGQSCYCLECERLSKELAAIRARGETK